MSEGLRHCSRLSVCQYWKEENLTKSAFLSVAVTLLSVWCMLVLFYAEVKDFMTPSITEDLFVDTSRGPKLRINLDIIMPTISCPCKCGAFFSIIKIVSIYFWTDFNLQPTLCLSSAVLSLDAMDSAGEHHLHIDHNIYKRRLDLLGQPLEDPQKEGIIKLCLTDIILIGNKILFYVLMKLFIRFADKHIDENIYRNSKSYKGE